jgi:type II secretory pathway pseudopilin PulG
MVRARACSRTRGFSLVEALFAIALLFMALGSFLTLLPNALQKNDHDAYYLQAVAAGQEYLDALRGSVENAKPEPTPPSIAIDPGGSVVGGTTKTSPGYFTITGDCKVVTPLSPMRDCVVTVQWTERTQLRSYGIESYATQQVN